MALVPVDSRVAAVTTNSVTVYTFGAGFRNLAVVNLTGSGSVGYRFDTSTNQTTTNPLTADNWVLPAAVGSSWQHSLVGDDGNADDETAPAFYVEITGAQADTVAVTAWA